ncbi:MAG: bifunctional (p)ppGpp synthetase/guanosine-3',5'-bis(diphosphate) 3'-pyrophosphohydrolase [Deltaproteobacteria bacterium]|nr:bifunctional (p)ppGpp synthetase/guanosine-3',5'-bis(diphosphate) 3'-pyrophosphohydrolase [Deltaproteobacteria bacterium]
MVRLEEIIEKVSGYSPGADLEVIRKAYVFSGVVHQGQTRMSGEPYLIHPLEVADILTGLKMDPQSVATGLLHDTVEDTHTTIEKIEDAFGPEVAGLVDGLTKISRITFEKKEDREAENFRKMILAMSKDIRVILIKLADRLHNMRTLGALPPERQKKIARETFDIYAPIANRLGIGWIKTELEDLSFKYLEPERHAMLAERIAREWDVKHDYIEKIKGIIEAKLKEHGVAGEVSGRPKQLYSIYKKMRDQDVEFENIYDIIAYRVIVKSVKECYEVLGIIHSTWRPVPGRFKDYIALTKGNMYQSLHTTVVGPYGVRMEVQIRTEEMHRIADYGIAAHWKYKEGGAIDSKDDKRFAWLRQLLEWHKELKDSDEFMDSLRGGLFPEEVFVFTPKGDIKEFPAGASAVDFAYSIHTDVGNRCTGAKVNGRMVPLKYKLRSGDVVEIITSQNHHPSKDWLSFVASSRAKTRIRHWIKTDERQLSITLGKELCEREFGKHGLEFGRMWKAGDIERIARDAFGLSGAESILAGIGYGKISVQQLLGKILPPEKLAPKKVSAFQKVLDKFKPLAKTDRKSPVVVKGIDDVMVKFARCCNPLPGDEIVGFITHGQGVTVHSAGCPSLMQIDKDRRIDVAWDRGKKEKTTRPARIEVVCRNEKGLLADMSNAIKAADANITDFHIKITPENKAVCNFEVEVMDAAHLKNIIKLLGKVKKVLKVQRAVRDASAGGEAEGTH